MKKDSAGKASVLFIVITILIDAIGMGLLIPVLPDVLRRFSSDPTFVSEYYGYFIGAYALMQFVASPVLGSLSDRYGRRPILLISLLGAGIDYIFMAYAPTLTLLFIGRVISGLTGASMTVASSYMADISDEKDRPANFGLIGAGWGVGFIVGPMLGGLLGSYGPLAPFIAAAVLNLVNFLFGSFVLPESLPKERRRQITLAKLNPLTSILKVLRLPEIVGLIGIYFLLFLAGQVHPVNWTLYTEMRYGWTARDVGLSLSFVGVTFALSQVFLTRSLIPKLGEKRSVTLGILVSILCFALYGLAPQGWMMYGITVFFALSGIGMPALQSLIAAHVPSNEQGELQGSLVSLGSIACVLSPALYTILFVKFTKPGTVPQIPGIAYLTASLICVLTLLFWMVAQRNSTVTAQSHT